MKKQLKRTGLTLLALMLLAVVGFYIYTLDYYRASDYVTDYVADSGLDIETKDNHTYIYPAIAGDTGIIFYPGGKVEARAYMPLMIKLAQAGYTAVLVEMPMNLAVFNVNGAKDVLEENTEIKHWYLAGHSLGGAMASSFAGTYHGALEGLILMGAYPVNNAPIESLAIYGTHDLMLDRDKVMTADELVEIVDGNHAWFGDYGEQEGDGQALITREDQQQQAVAAIHQFIQKH